MKNQLVLSLTSKAVDNQKRKISVALSQTIEGWESRISYSTTLKDLEYYWGGVNGLWSFGLSSGLYSFEEYSEIVNRVRPVYIRTYNELFSKERTNVNI